MDAGIGRSADCLLVEESVDLGPTSKGGRLSVRVSMDLKKKGRGERRGAQARVTPSLGPHHSRVVGQRVEPLEGGDRHPEEPAGGVLHKV